MAPPPTARRVHVRVLPYHGGGIDPHWAVVKQRGRGGEWRGWISCVCVCVCDGPCVCVWMQYTVYYTSIGIKKEMKKNDKILGRKKTRFNVSLNVRRKFVLVTKKKMGKFLVFFFFLQASSSSFSTPLAEILLKARPPEGGKGGSAESLTAFHRADIAV